MYKIEGDTVIFDKNFNDILTEDILNEISDYSHIQLGWNFNQQVDNLPEGLKILTFCGKFNQPIDNLPQGLEVLKLGRNFNQPIDNLPKGLKELALNCNFNQPIDNLPQGLKKLEFSFGFNEFNQPLDFLPNSLEELIFCTPNYSYDLLNLPSNLKKITVCYNYKGQIVRPPNCEKIEF